MTPTRLHDLVVSEVLDGEVVKFGSRELSAYRLIQDAGVEMWVCADELAALLTGNADQVEWVRNRIRRHLAEKARAWLEANEELVSERLAEIEEDARADAAGAEVRMV